jgi:hypothetical protein
MDDTVITDMDIIKGIMAYNKAYYLPTWCIHTPPESTIGGFSAKLIGIGIAGDVFEIEWAGGDRQIVPKSEVHLRGQL